MASKLSGFKPSSLWEYFEEFLKIPHCSGNEKALGDYIISVAEELGLKWKRDDNGNVVVYKDASPGLEGAPGVILQGHLDMVCEKNSDVEHDFAEDPIQAEIEGEWVTAKGTTLGADNGIGGCAALAVMAADDLTHPPLEFLFTVEEETGLTGASQLPKDILSGKKLLNLDSEELGEFTIGCAGGADTRILLPVKRESGQPEQVFRLKLAGFKGGHSGIDIHEGRGNAIKLLSRMLWKASRKVSFQLIGIEGGNLRNAIPREAWADLAFDPDKKSELQQTFQEEFEAVKKEFRVQDPGARHEFEAAANSRKPPLTQNISDKVTALLLTMPHGVMSMHPEIEGLVQTSTNLAVIHTKEENIEVVCSTRSSIGSSLEETRDAIEALGGLADAEVIREDGYPGWTPDLDSELLKASKRVYKQVFDDEPEVAAIHAGLECGIIGEKYPGMDMISFGPTIKNPHSPDEKVHIESVEKFWTFLITLLKELT
ncbi:MAG: aminoacyl-histidine dipeptidase [Candidatus Aminicenantes bacterium]